MKHSSELNYNYEHTTTGNVLDGIIRVRHLKSVLVAASKG
jgi:hypothetical protein